MADETNPSDSHDVEAAVNAVYAELRSIAARHLGRERAGHTLQPTALVHEAYVRLAKQKGLHWESRLHFLHIAAAQIRLILVDHARKKARHKRGGGRTMVTYTESVPDKEKAVDLLDLDDALNRLEVQSSVSRQIVELKFFGGLTEPEIASVLDVSERTVRRRWTFARTWLYQELAE